jgi:LEA14-like dessication related protein
MSRLASGPLPVCLLILLLGSGCSSVQTPTATFRNASLQNVNAQGFTLNFDIDLKNPNGFAVPLSTADYQLALAGVKVLEGKAKPEGTIPANGTLPIKLPVNLTFENLMAAEKAIVAGKGDVAYTLDGGLSVTSSSPLMLGQSPRVPLKYEGTLKLREVLADPMIALQNPTVRRLAQQALGGMFGR